jgi:RNA 3'-terminal phosphate cyclase (ATP)
MGGSELAFFPGRVSAGSYVLEIGTAGSATLLFQCLYFPLALAGESELTLRGGTHVRHSPSFHYLAWIWLPAMRMFGLGGELHLRRAGFYPEGAGEFRAVIAPKANPPSSLHWPARGTLREMEVTSFVGSLPLEIAERQTQAAVAALREIGIYCIAENLPLPAAPSAGTGVFIRAQFENTIAGFSALGERGKPAEEVGREAAKQVAEFMESGGAVDEHLGDQLLVPASLLAAGRLGAAQPASTEFTPAKITSHLRTNASVLQKFLPVTVEVSPSGRVQIAPAAADTQG